MIKLLFGINGFSSIPIILLSEFNSMTPKFSGLGTDNPKTLPPKTCIFFKAALAKSKYFSPRKILSLKANTEDESPRKSLAIK